MGLPSDVPIEDVNMEEVQDVARKKASETTFHSVGFKVDVTDRLITILKNKATLKIRNTAY